MVPMPEMERRRHAFRPILSASGAQAMVVMRLMSEIRMVSKEDEIGRRPERRETEYIIMLLMPQNCCANMMPMTATMAGWYTGSFTTWKKPMWGMDFWDALDVVEPRREVLSESWRRPSSSSPVLGISQFSVSSAIECPLPRIRCKVREARAGSLCAANHAGLSGTKHNPNPCRRPIPAPAASIILHRFPLLKKYPSVCVIKIPLLIVTCVIDPNKPLSFGGATSEIYSGTTTVLAPAPIPARKRPIDMIGTVPANVSRPEPSTKKKLVIRIARSLP